jgi:hypothetical protein
MLPFYEWAVFIKAPGVAGPATITKPLATYGEKYGEPAATVYR